MKKKGKLYQNTKKYIVSEGYVFPESITVTGDLYFKTKILALKIISLWERREQMRALGIAIKFRLPARKRGRMFVEKMGGG